MICTLDCFNLLEDGKDIRRVYCVVLENIHSSQKRGNGVSKEWGGFEEGMYSSRKFPYLPKTIIMPLSRGSVCFESRVLLQKSFLTGSEIFIKFLFRSKITLSFLPTKLLRELLKS